MTHTNMPAVDRLWDAIAPNLPILTAEEQHVGITLVRELAKGEPVTMERLARSLGTTPARARELMDRKALQAWSYADANGRIVGFLGLAAAPMHHRFVVGGRTLWAWCAGDSLFLPRVLDETAKVESPDPETGELVRLTTSPVQVEAVDPPGVVVSMVDPNAPDFTSAKVIMETACHYIFFFTSRVTGERWVVKHPGTWLLSVDEAFEFGRRFTARTFAEEIERHAVSA